MILRQLRPVGSVSETAQSQPHHRSVEANLQIHQGNGLLCGQAIATARLETRGFRRRVPHQDVAEEATDRKTANILG